MSTTQIVDPASIRQAGARPLIWPIAIVALALLLGALIAVLSATSVAVLFAPLGILILLIFWAMPAPKSVPENTAWLLLICVLAVTAVWPSYLALRLPGLPWVNLSRLLNTTFLVVWLYCILNSQRMRAALAEDYQANKPVFLFLAGWVAVMVVGIAVSRDPAESALRVINYQLANTAMFFAVACLANTSARLTWLSILIVCCGVFEMANGFVEAHAQSPLWVDFAPPGFAFDEEFVEAIRNGVWREGEYRVQGSFFVSLSYAEFLVLTLPFIYHFGLTARNWIWKAFWFGLVLVSFPAIYVSHSRLGMVGFFLVGLVYAGFFAFWSWRRSKQNLLGPIMVLFFPLLLIGFFGAVSVSNRLQDAMLGDGATQASDDGRVVQRQLAIPKILASPIVGYGMSQGGVAVGYRNAGGQGTFDNYIFLVALDNGLTGLACFLGFIIWVIFKAARLYFAGRTDISRLGAAISTCFIAFLVIKWVLAQQENHHLIMAVAGMLIAILRIERSSTEIRSQLDPARAVRVSAHVNRKAKHA
jgi:O-Antigen ligase